MAKVTLSKIAPIKKIDPVTISINENEVTVTQYLPVVDKLAFVERVLNNTLDDTGFLNPMRLDIYFNIEIIRTYTNISITDKMMEDPQKLYDTLEINKIIDAVVGAIPEDEYNDLFDAVGEAGDHAVAYLNSFVGMMKTISADYRNTEMNVDKLMTDLGNPEAVGFVKEVLDKIG